DIYSFARLCEMAAEARISSIVDCNHSRFLAPESMIAELQAACKESGQPVPTTPGQLAAVIYNSLAKCYADTARDLETRTGKTYDWIHIVGGGSNAEYLNRLTAEAAGKPVLAGPSEATAIGNLLVQMRAANEFEQLTVGRQIVKNSFEVKEFYP
ncbi:MAG: rhamnulokinase, partial [Clostridiaceae bacterium]|nr:rhamnulokinase [Clostridiaceae bacterium]